MKTGIKTRLKFFKKGKKDGGNETYANPTRQPDLTRAYNKGLLSGLKKKDGKS